MIEGYTRFGIQHQKGAPPAGTAELDALRTRLHDLGLVGQNQEGYGVGNVSIRVGGDQFIITGTQTGKPRQLGEMGYTLVTDYSLAENRVACLGPVAASSETLSHGAIYLADPKVGSVLHVHSSRMWEYMLAGDYLSTAVQNECGTVALAQEIAKLAPKPTMHPGLMVLAGHQDGILAFGGSLDQAADRLLSCHEKARSAR
jgi:ribulose-5-phosphate 4-epimerase/fuculose-1-phosphate aldolase